jgi:hypothetical protein
MTIHNTLLFAHWLEKRGLRWVRQRVLNELVNPSFAPLRRIIRFQINLRSKILMFAHKLFGHSSRASIDVSTLFFIFDLQVCPIAFDVVTYMAGAEIERRRRGLARIHVLVVPGRDKGMRLELPEYDAVVDVEARRFRLFHLVMPCFSFLPSCTGFTLCSSRQEVSAFTGVTGTNIFPADWLEALPSRPQPRWVFDASRSGEKIFPILTAPLAALRYVDQYIYSVASDRRVIVISLRQYKYSPARNSNLSAWAMFAQILQLQNYAVIFVMDTEEALNPLPSELRPYSVFLPGSWNLALRMALYQRAFLNLAISQGPMELCWFNEVCRYLLFFSLDSAPLTSLEHLKAQGIDVGGDLPFAKPWQRWVWEKDDLEIISKEFSYFLPLLEGLDATL